MQPHSGENGRRRDGEAEIERGMVIVPGAIEEESQERGESHVGQADDHAGGRRQLREFRAGKESLPQGGRGGVRDAGSRLR